MLQQTQVATVLPYYRRFLERFPNVRSLARADQEEVLALWSGLGYYRRARSLHAGAREVVEKHGGRLPDDPKTLTGLPGIGRYTAGAIASIAFELCEPVLDGNVRRVLSRLFAVDAEELSVADERRLLWSLASDLVRGSEPGQLNQGLMELGATICTPRAPRCPDCAVGSVCRANLSGERERYPRSRPRPAITTSRVAVGWVRRGGRVLLERTGPDNPFRGVWDLPAVELGFGGDDPRRGLADALRQRHGLEVVLREVGPRTSHGIMQRRLLLDPCLGTLRRGRVAGCDDLRWVAPAALGHQATSGATLKLARLLEPVVG